jgi:hypothetical protein
VLRDVSCDACKTYLVSHLLLTNRVFIYFKEYSDTEQSLTYPSQKVVETLGTSVALMEFMMQKCDPLEFGRTTYHISH